MKFSTLSQGFLNRITNALILQVDRGANVNCTDRWGNTPLHGALLSGRIDIVAYLKSKGAVESVDPASNEQRFERRPSFQKLFSQPDHVQ